MQPKSAKKLFIITMLLPSQQTKTVKVKAASRAVAIQRALKREPNAIGVLTEQE